MSLCSAVTAERPGRRVRPALPLLLAVTLALLAGQAGAAQAGEKFVFMTNWFAEAEHGGFYQALATGQYRKYGLDVDIRMGGAQVNITQLMAAGQADCIMGASDLQVVMARENGVPLVTVAAMFQKDPDALIAHEDVHSLADMKNHTILIAASSYQNFWPWLKARYGFTDAQARPYTFNIQPFVADKNIVQQGYLSSEPYAIEKEAHFKPSVFLLSDYGWPPYATTVVCMKSTIEKKPKAVAAFVKASMEGWKDYIEGDPAPANALIRRDNPNMTDDELANGIKLMRATGMVAGGDAAKLGIGIVTPERMKKTYDMLVSMKLLDPAKVDVTKTYTTQFVEGLKILP